MKYNTDELIAYEIRKLYTFYRIDCEDQNKEAIGFDDWFENRLKMME